MNIIQPSVFMKSDPSDSSHLETECLFGETVKIFDECSGWFFCKLITDGYFGWIKKNGLGYLDKSTHRVIAKRSFIYKNRNSKSNCIHYVPMGSNLVIKNIEDNWAEVSLSNKNTQYIGYIPCDHIVKLGHKVNDWVTIAQQLNGTPYRWGGRDSIGIDCSALLQLSYQTYGEIIPRNTSQQIKLKKKVVNNINDLKRGCVVFLEGHVGIMVDNVNCIHANAFHMMTLVEPLKHIINRVEGTLKIKKMMDFNKN